MFNLIPDRLVSFHLSSSRLRRSWALPLLATPCLLHRRRRRRVPRSSRTLPTSTSRSRPVRSLGEEEEQRRLGLRERGGNRRLRFRIRHSRNGGWSRKLQPQPVLLLRQSIDPGHGRRWRRICDEAVEEGIERSREVLVGEVEDEHRWSWRKMGKGRAEG